VRTMVVLGLVAALLVCGSGCTFVQPRQVVIHAVGSEPSEKAKDLPACDTGNWQATVAGVGKLALDALMMSQCKLCQLGYVARQVGLPIGGAATEWMQRAQTNRMAGHRVAIPLGNDEPMPLVYTFQAHDGTVQSLVIPQSYIERAPPGVAAGLFGQALATSRAARERLARETE